MNIEKMTYAELVQLNERVTKAMPDARARELATARKAVADIAAANGFALTELIGEPAQTGPEPVRFTSWTPPVTKRARKSKTATKLKDRNGVIYEGRGRRPKNFDKASAVAMAA